MSMWLNENQLIGQARLLRRLRIVLSVMLLMNFLAFAAGFFLRPLRVENEADTTTAMVEQVQPDPVATPAADPHRPHLSGTEVTSDRPDSTRHAEPSPPEPRADQPVLAVTDDLAHSPEKTEDARQAAKDALRPERSVPAQLVQHPKPVSSEDAVAVAIESSATSKLTRPGRKLELAQAAQRWVAASNPAPTGVRVEAIENAASSIARVAIWFGRSQARPQADQTKEVAQASDAAAEAVVTKQPLVLLNPSSNQVAIAFLIDQRIETVPAGSQLTVDEPGEHVIRFHRGGTFGEASHQLRGGTYEFQATASGWMLQPVEEDPASE